MPRPPPPPPLSVAEALPTFNKWLKGGTKQKPTIPATDSAAAYPALAKRFNGTVSCVQVCPGKEQWARPARVPGHKHPIVAGTQQLDGLWQHLKLFIKHHRPHLSELPTWVRAF